MIKKALWILFFKVIQKIKTGLRVKNLSMLGGWDTAPEVIPPERHKHPRKIEEAKSLFPKLSTFQEAKKRMIWGFTLIEI